LLRPGANFINISQAAFIHADHKSTKKTDNLTVFLALLGSALPYNSQNPSFVIFYFFFLSQINIQMKCLVIVEKIRNWQICEIVETKMAKSML